MSVHDKNQLAPSIEKLMHYLAVYVKNDTVVEVFDDKGTLYKQEFKRPTSVSISPTLYTRIDDCHGAGNCCRVPFDLVYTEHDYQRVVDYRHNEAVEAFGKESAEGFRKLREELLRRFEVIDFSALFDWGNSGYSILSKLYIQRNVENFWMTGRKSCPYLVMGEDRYFCGVHPFKPLHCWYPHMTVRAMKPRNDGEGPSISIGRMQYGRNHKFGCPVIFTESVEKDDSGLFDAPGEDGPNYFDSQFGQDVSKLEWTSDSAASLGFTRDNNFAVGIHESLSEARGQIRRCLANGTHQPITIWKP